MAIQEGIKSVIEVVRQGDVILYPTDTMWEVGYNATNTEAVVRAYKIRRWDDSKTLICLVDSNAWLQRYMRQVPSVARDLLDVAVKSTTIILDGAINLALSLIAEDGGIALCITKEPFSHKLCYCFQKTLMSTGANISGELAAANYCDISQEIFDAVDYVCHSRGQEHKPHTPSNIIKLAENGEVTVIRKQNTRP